MSRADQGLYCRRPGRSATPATRRPRAVRLLAAVLGLAASSAAWADGGPRRMPASVPPAYTQECGSCHLAYPPGLLPAPSWQRLMGGLDRHFGTDASLDAATARQLAAWLLAQAGTERRVAEPPPQDRITRSAWFERKHRAIDPAVWRLPSVQGAAQCAACHVGAEQGRFDDDALRLPAGLSARQRRAWSD